jgi:hypothetical protein
MKSKEARYYKGTWYFRTKIDAIEFYRVLNDVYWYWHTITLKWVCPTFSESWKQRKKLFNNKARVLTKVSKLEILLICGCEVVRS